VSIPRYRDTSSVRVHASWCLDTTTCRRAENFENPHSSKFASIQTTSNLHPHKWVTTHIFFIPRWLKTRKFSYLDTYIPERFQLPTSSSPTNPSLTNPSSDTFILRNLHHTKPSSSKPSSSSPSSSSPSSSSPSSSSRSSASRSSAIPSSACTMSTIGHIDTPTCLQVCIKWYFDASTSWACGNALTHTTTPRLQASMFTHYNRICTHPWLNIAMIANGNTPASLDTWCVHVHKWECEKHTNESTQCLQVNIQDCPSYRDTYIPTGLHIIIFQTYKPPKLWTSIPQNLQNSEPPYKQGIIKSVHLYTFMTSYHNDHKWEYTLQARNKTDSVHKWTCWSKQCNISKPQCQLVSIQEYMYVNLLICRNTPSCFQIFMPVPLIFTDLWNFTKFHKVSQLRKVS